MPKKAHWDPEDPEAPDRPTKTAEPKAASSSGHSIIPPFFEFKKCSDMNYVWPAVFWLYTAQRGAEESALRGEASTQRAERPEPLTS